jgi:hypothetical protein
MQLVCSICVVDGKYLVQIQEKYTLSAVLTPFIYIFVEDKVN